MFPLLLARSIMCTKAETKEDLYLYDLLSSNIVAIEATAKYDTEMNSGLPHHDEVPNVEKWRRRMVPLHLMRIKYCVRDGRTIYCYDEITNDCVLTLSDGNYQ